ncbi:MAG: Do family serine endopeptidase [Deltaproteobacteria bacterium]|nr:Do family serine endopeptidase [Deltaproteobacteria bacterium]
MAKPVNRFNIILAIFLMPLCLPAIGHSEYNRRDAIVNAVQKVSTAVVNVSSEYEIHSRPSPFSGFGIDPFFDSFFKDFFDPGFRHNDKRTSLGSGVIIDGKRGFILTNAHVISKAEAISVVLQDERKFNAQLVGADPDSDLAVLRIISKEALPAIEMGRSDDLMIGETVIAIGNPFGFSHTVTTGVISALNRSIRTNDMIYHNFIQTDASINPGNSGGPLLNINGDLIGINTAIYAKAQGIGFAIPINKARRIITDLIQYGEVVLSWTGLLLQGMDPDLARYLNVPGEKGLLVKAVEPASPAGRSGIQAEDILLAIEKRPVPSISAYNQVLRDYPVDSNIHLTVLRGGKRLTVALKTEAYPEDRILDLAYNLLGIQVESLSFKNRKAFRIAAKKGVMISEVIPQAYLAKIGVAPGDVIRQIDDFSIETIDDFKKAMVQCRQKKTIVILIQRGEQGYYLSVKL